MKKNSIEKECVCGKKYLVQLNRLKQGRGKFCSKKCQYQNAHRPSGLNYKIKVKNKAWFKKGHTPWSKGKNGLRISPSTEFKKGHVPFSKLNPEMMPREECHHNWKGDDVGYCGLHNWVYNKLGRPNECEFCKKIVKNPKAIHWANKSGNYKREVTDWIRLCVSCHKKYDKRKK
jgi:hypothetical protein